MYAFEDIKPNGMVDVWDLGPVRPTAPDAPVEPKKTGRATDDALAQQQHEDALGDYKKQVQQYAAQKKEYDEHRAGVGGPIKIEAWPHDAQEWVTNHPERWAKELPAGMKPGKGQAEIEAAAAKRAEETTRIKERDPHMGKGSAPS
jgi:hypothetical protein